VAGISVARLGGGETSIEAEKCFLARGGGRNRGQSGVFFEGDFGRVGGEENVVFVGGFSEAERSGFFHSGFVAFIFLF
jgi:hypothetical protein